MINNLYIKATPTTASVTWGDITGTLSDQTDLQSALDDKQDALTLTTTGTSGAATLVGSTLNIPQYSGGGSSNPSVIAASYVDGTTVTGTTAQTISLSLLVPANTFTGNGALEILCRLSKTGVLGTSNMRISKNTSNTLTGSTLIASTGSNTANTLFNQSIRTPRINSDVMTIFSTGTSNTSDYATTAVAANSIPFVTSVDNYIIFSIQLSNAADSANVSMARLTKYQ